ncbi:putative tyrosinase-like protein tyr-3 [Trichinella pseudospiralis]|uniref:Putative tyrosinase-like protein tyr-3 n=1 Tax=Trichinella pseudospiralis TaxID=6337 RepID=A0A0V1JHQ7_TRIPS|nr:putative tyrosinase-like protein tyr-3 [Trichinella pseudospiralis]
MNASPLLDCDCLPTLRDCLPYNIAAMHTAMGIINKRQLLIIAFLQLSFSILASSLDSLSLNQIKQIITSLSPMGKAWIFNEDDSCGNKKCKAPYQLCTISYIAKGSEELHYECSKVSESCLSLIRSIKKKALAAKQRDHPLRDIPVQQESEITDADESGEATSNGEKEDSSCDNSAALSISQQSFPFWGSIIIAPIAGCFNGHNMCCEWASKGECNRNPVMMKTLCKQACGTCSCQADEVLLCKPVVNAISCLPPKKTPDCKPKKPKVAQTTTALPESPAGDSEESLVVIDVEEPLIISEEVEKPTDTEQPPTESVSEEVPEEVVSQELTTVEETTSAYVTEKTETAVEEVVTTAKKEEVEEEEEQLSTETAIAVSEEEEAPSEEMKVEATEAPAEAEISTETVEKVVKETIEEVSPAEITDITPEITPEAESISEGETVEEEQPEETVKEPMEIPSEAPSEVSSEFPSETTVGITCAEPEKEIVEVETTEKVSEQPEVTTETSPPEISEIEEEVQTTISEAAETTETESTEAPEIITEAAMETEIETEVTETPQAFPETTETEIIPEVMTTTEMPSPVTEKVTEPEVISTKIPATTPQPIPSTITPRVTYPTGPLVTETVPQSYPTTTPQPPGYETTTSRPIYTRYGPPAGMQDTCPDLLITCAFWASQGECSKNPYWMKPNCQRSCNSCGATVSSIDSPSPKPAGPSMSVSDFQDVLTIMNSASSGNHLESAYQTEHTWQATAHFHAAHVECSQFQCLVALLWLTAVETTSAKIHYIYQQYFNLADLVNLARQMSYKVVVSMIMGKLLVFIAFLFPYFTCICKAVEIDFAAQEENLLLQYVKYILETYPKECAPEPGKKWFTCKVPQFWCSTLDESTEESKNASVFNHQCIQHSCLILLDNAVLPTKSVRPESSILLAKKDLDSTKPQLTFMTKNKIVDKNEESFWRNIFFGEKDLKLAAKLTGLNIAEEESLLPPLQETFILNNNKNNENSAAHVVQSDAADLINKKPVLGRENISKSTKLNETGYIDSKLLDFLFVFSDSHRNFLSKKGEINTPQCIDKHIKCLFWSLIGECDKNPFWMLPNCQKSCFSCGMTVADVNTPSPIIGPLSPEKYWKLSNPKTMDQCNDHFDACCEWALLGKCEQLPALIGIACPVSCGTCNCNKSDISTCTMEETKCRNNSEAFDYNERTKKENNTLLIIGSTSFNKEILTKISERNTTESVNAEREMNHDEVQLKEKLTEVISLSFANFSTNNNNNSNNNNTILISESERASEENSNNEISSDEISDEVISHLNKETSINKTHKIDAFRNESLSIFGETIAPTKETLLLPTESSVLGTFFKKTQQCKDKNSLCLLWAIIGECTKNPYWMKPNCQRSCNTCGMTLKDVNKELLSPDCNNQHELCQFWASINECTNNPDFMLINCAASCKSCSKLIKQN